MNKWQTEPRYFIETFNVASLTGNPHPGNEAVTSFWIGPLFTESVLFTHACDEMTSIHIRSICPEAKSLSLNMSTKPNNLIAVKWTTHSRHLHFSQASPSHWKIKFWKILVFAYWVIETQTFQTSTLTV